MLHRQKQHPTKQPHSKILHKKDLARFADLRRGVIHTSVPI